MPRMPTDRSVYLSDYEAGLLFELKSGTARLNSFMTEPQFLRKLVIACRHISVVFQKARSAPRGGSTPSYIAGVEDKIGTLAEVVVRTIGQDTNAWEEIFSDQNLPKICKGYKPKDNAAIVEFVRCELIVRALIAMKDAGLLCYQNEGWAVGLTCLDERSQLEARFRRMGGDSYQKWGGFHPRCDKPVIIARPKRKPRASMRVRM